MLTMHVKICKKICFHNCWKYYTYTEKNIGYRKSCTSNKGVNRQDNLFYKLRNYATIIKA